MLHDQKPNTNNPQIMPCLIAIQVSGRKNARDRSSTERETKAALTSMTETLNKPDPDRELAENVAIEPFLRSNYRSSRELRAMHCRRIAVGLSRSGGMLVVAMPLAFWAPM